MTDKLKDEAAPVLQLLKTAPEDFPAFLAKNKESMIQSDHPWSDYMRAKFR